MLTFFSLAVFPSPVITYLYSSNNEVQWSTNALYYFFLSHMLWIECKPIAKILISQTRLHLYYCACIFSLLISKVSPLVLILILIMIKSLTEYDCSSVLFSLITKSVHSDNTTMIYQVTVSSNARRRQGVHEWASWDPANSGLTHSVCRD